IPVLTKLGAGIDVYRLSNAVKTALDAHPYIYTTLFADENGDIRARRNASPKSDIPVITCDELPKNNELVRPFDLLDSPLYRAAIYKTNDGNYLFLDFHHIISDGTSEAILFSDIDSAYSGKPVTAESYTGFEAALEEEKSRATDRYAKAKAYYDGVFAGCETECLPPKSPESEKAEAASLTFALGVDESTVGEYCDKHKLTQNAFFNAAFGYTLSRFGLSQNLVYTTVYNGRSDSRLASSFAMLVKTIPVLINAENDENVSEWIHALQNQMMNSMANDLYSFAEISHAYGIKSDILFVYQGEDFTVDSIGGEHVEMKPVLPDVAKAPISVNVYRRCGGYDIVADYRRDMYSAAYIECLVDGFAQAIRSFIRSANLRDVSLLSENAKARLAKINDTKRDFENIPVHRFVERHAASHPDKTAVIGNGKKLSFGELNKSANKIAHSLIKHGVTKDTVVGLLLERGVEISLVELGILKAGGAFLGLLPSYPDDRIDFCLCDSESPIVITTADILEKRAALFCGDKPYRALTLDELLTEENDENPDISVPTDSLTYCITRPARRASRKA
ncbi:MAG: AMP-binding protein, partial [Clostridiales bacterium]|nr:AMP-binding protein [Clostridiales bacterium]